MPSLGGSSGTQTSEISGNSLEAQNALRSANNYLNTMPFSYNGLIKQLEYEGYSHAAATYAASHCGADWNLQAKLAAKKYLSITIFRY